MITHCFKRFENVYLFLGTAMLAASVLLSPAPSAKAACSDNGCVNNTTCAGGGCKGVKNDAKGPACACNGNNNSCSCL